VLRTARPKPTLKDVAKLARCSTAVVSTVVNNARGNTLASPEMQQRVREAARKLGYRPNFASRSLVRRSAQTIGIYVPHDPWAGLGMRYEGAIVQGIEQACRGHGYDVLAINLSGAGAPETCVQKFAEQRIDGLVLLHVDHVSDWVAPLVQQASDHVVAVNYYGDAPVDRVNFDDRAATSMAVQHLASLGHRKIGYIGSRRASWGPGADLRCAGYRDAMVQLGLVVKDQWIWDFTNPDLVASAEANASKDDGSAGALHLWQLGEHERPTAILAYSDLIAIRAMRQLRRLGCRIPQDISVVGIDGSDMGELVWPQLTSILQPFAAMGRRATELVIQRANARRHATEHAGPIHEMVAPELVVRESTTGVTH
jgi:LacI family transcriptional regulator